MGFDLEGENGDFYCNNGTWLRLMNYLNRCGCFIKDDWLWNNGDTVPQEEVLKWRDHFRDLDDLVDILPELINKKILESGNYKARYCEPDRMQIISDFKEFIDANDSFKIY